MSSLLVAKHRFALPKLSSRFLLELLQFGFSVQLLCAAKQCGEPPYVIPYEPNIVTYQNTILNRMPILGHTHERRVAVDIPMKSANIRCHVVCVFIKLPHLATGQSSTSAHRYLKGRYNMRIISS